MQIIKECYYFYTKGIQKLYIEKQYKITGMIYQYQPQALSSIFWIEMGLIFWFCILICLCIAY